jgi:hypothetical protein
MIYHDMMEYMTIILIEIMVCMPGMTIR